MAAFHFPFVVMLLLASSVSRAASEAYSQNAICRQNSCVNPLFPGMNDLARLEQIVWQCTNHSMVSSHLEFCKGAVIYDPALPSPNTTSQPVSQLVKGQDDAAAIMYVYHLSGLGYEHWDHDSPATSTNECVRSVWKMACYTYFPRAEAGCRLGEASAYKRPCRSCCENYLTACAVECCDESPKCVFTHKVQLAEKEIVQTGYVDALGPSALCTGAAGRGAKPAGLLSLALPAMLAFLALPGSRRQEARDATAADAPRGRRGVALLLPVLAAASALGLQGCTAEVPKHHVGNWRAKPDYLVAFEFVEPGRPATAARLNSCTVPGIPATLQCSGRGYCKEWNQGKVDSNPVSFCVCERDWADPECRTRRKSQITAFLCSLFAGFLGVDYFYLGFPLWGAAKLVTLGGFGFWWLVDIVRVGAGAVYGQKYRVANDLPHWVFVLSTVSLFSLVGFLTSVESYLSYRKKKREDVMKLQESEEAHKPLHGNEADVSGPRFRFNGQASFDGRRGFSGYGATLPMPHPNAQEPYAAMYGMR